MRKLGVFLWQDILVLAHQPQSVGHRNCGNVDEVGSFDARAFWFSASKSKRERAKPQESSAVAMDSAKAETLMNTGFSTFGRIVGRPNRLLAATVGACIRFA